MECDQKGDGGEGNIGGRNGPLLGGDGKSKFGLKKYPGGDGGLPNGGYTRGGGGGRPLTEPPDREEGG